VPAIEKGKDTMRRAGRPLILSLLVASLVLATFVWPAGQARAAKPAKPQPPNILFIIMDDVGIDQFEKTFGVGAEDAAPTPAMDTLATGGLRAGTSGRWRNAARRAR
jgi:hypothetical protein